MRRRVWLVGGLCAAMLGGELAAQPTAPAESQPPATMPPKLRLPARSTPDGTSAAPPQNLPPHVSVWGTVAALAILGVGLTVIAQLLRRHGPAGLRTLPTDAVEPLGQRFLSRGVTVHLLRCGSRVLLVAVGPDGARTLTEICDPVEVDLLTGACRQRNAEQPSFAHVFRRTPTAAEKPSAVPRERVLVTEVDGV